MGRKSIQAIAWLLLMAAGCSKKNDQPAPPPVGGGARALVVCEGSLGNGNSSLGLYLPGGDSVYDDVFKAANGQPLGDVFQSMTRIGDHYLLCINNSDKILRIRRDSWLIDGTLNISKPRYILKVSDTKAYVSSLFSDKLYVIDPQAMQLTRTITLPYRNPEGMLLSGSTAYVCCWDTANSNLLALNTATDALTTYPLPGAYAPQEAVMDRQQRMWVLAGNVTNGKRATLSVVDPASAQVLKTWPFPAAADPLRPVFNPTLDTLYFIEVDYNGGTANNGIYRMPVNAASLPQQPFIPTQGFQYYWALGIQPGTGYIYVGDPKGFTQKGIVSIYRQDGTKVRDFRTGIGPGHFFFDE